MPDPIAATPPAASAAPAPAVLPVRSLPLAWRQARADLADGGLRLLLVSLALAVAALTAVGFFADRLAAALQRDAGQLLGGDAVVASTERLPPAFVERARREGLRAVESVAFPSMARADEAQGGQLKLASLKAVGPGYPLRGVLKVRAGADAPEVDAAAGPAPGEAWAEAALLDAIGVAPGQKLWLGDKALVVGRILTREPDRGAGFLGFAPRVLMHLDDLEATGLVQPASRVTWRLGVAVNNPVGRAADDLAVRRFVDWVRPQLPAVGAPGARASGPDLASVAPALRGARLETLESGQQAMQQALGRADTFLNLVALLAALLASVAVAMAARDHAAKRLDSAAVLRVLGAPQRAIAWASTWQFLGLGLAASAVGVLLGWLVHGVFVQLLGGLVGTTLPPPGWSSAWLGLGIGVALVLGFGLPPMLQLAAVPPLRVLRRELGTIRVGAATVWLAGLGALAALLIAAASDARLAGMAVGGFILAGLLFALLAWLALKVLGAAVPRMKTPMWVGLATRQVTARPGLAVVQVAALALGLMALALLVLLRTDMIAAWRQATPPDAPDRFVINLQPDQVDAFRARLQQSGVGKADIYPMIRGRLVAVNGKAVDSNSYAEDRAQRLVEREFNLSHAAAQPGHTPIVQGRWQPGEQDAVSIEEGLAKTLGLKLGDRMTFDIAGVERGGRITSIRKVDWGSMRVNFFVMFPLDAMQDLPATYVSSFHAPAQAAAFDRALATTWPNLTVIDVSATIAQVQQVLDQVIRAVEVLFGFTLAAGLAVLFAAIGATREHRAHGMAVMRALGASRPLLARVQRVELLGVGALAGLLATLAAIVLGGILARRFMEFEWAPAWWVPLAGTLVGALLAWAAGWFSLRGLLSRPVMQTLRASAA